MQSLHLRASFSRALNKLSYNRRQILTFAAVPLSVVMLAPVAIAASEPTAPTGAAPAAPVAKVAAAKPHLSARVSDARSISGDGIRIRARVKNSHSRTTITLKVRRAGSRAWSKVDGAVVRSGKRVTLRWRGGRPGTYLTRVVASNAGGTDRVATGRTHVFRKGHASYYGPGLYGGGLACGGRLTPSTVGVAHKTLPCGTKVTFNYGNRTVTARVIDRGPFIAGRDWDLTTGLKRKLGFGSTGVVNTTR
jgi:rare lipoprotein A